MRNNFYQKSPLRFFLFMAVFSCLLFSEKSFSKQNLRTCMLLPITDSIQGGIGFRVFEKLELYLRDSFWCYYRPNSEIIDILGNYHRNLNVHLKNKEVLKLLARKTKAGSLIRVELISEVTGILIKMEVIGENGEDIYFKERIIQKSDEIDVIAQTIQNWLDVYNKTIPYDGLVVGVLGDQFTVDMGTDYGIYNDTGVLIHRPLSKKRHPLLREIVSWEHHKIGEGIIFHAGKKQSHGRAKKYSSKRRLRLGDWVIVNRKVPEKLKGDYLVENEEDNGHKFGKIGKAGIFLDISSASVSSNTTTSTTNKIGGTIFGADADLEIWGTREFWGGLSLSRKFGTLKKEEGTLTNDSLSHSMTVLKLKAGYKYLPMGFFYGPQIDGYLGYGSYTYGTDNQVADGFGEVTFSGILLGARGSIPFKKLFRMHISMDFLLAAGYEEDTTIFGDADSSSTYSVEAGGSYLYGPAMTIQSSLGFTSSTAKFKSPARKISFQEIYINIGPTFTF
jgi:hypothetical protein